MSADSEVARSYREPPGVRVPAGAFTLLWEVCRGLATAVEAPRLYGYAHRSDFGSVVLGFHPDVANNWNEIEEESHWSEIYLEPAAAEHWLDCEKKEAS